jgi:hypothetical protein
MSFSPSESNGDHRFSDARHRDIVNRLEASKASGLITDYFVSWVGVAGRLSPVVRAWRNPDASEDRVRQHISSSLLEVINFTDLTIVDDDSAGAPV